MKQFKGTDVHGEWLVTVFEPEDEKPGVAEACFRPNQWATWGAPVRLTAVA